MFSGLPAGFFGQISDKIEVVRLVQASQLDFKNSFLDQQEPVFQTAAGIKGQHGFVRVYPAGLDQVL